MENLRWILLFAGIVFIIIVYLLSRRRSTADSHSVTHSQDDMPEFSATDLSMVDEGVGQVRIIASADDEVDGIRCNSTDSILENNESSTTEETSTSSASDLIALFVISSSEDESFGGEQINSAARASGLVFGDMNIFHHLDDSGLTMFSMANMLKPGSFDPEVMHETETSGITFFMQVSMVEQPAEALDEMLHTAYHMSEMLGGKLCNQQRQPLTEQDAEHYRQIAASH